MLKEGDTFFEVLNGSSRQSTKSQGVSVHADQCVQKKPAANAAGKDYEN